MIVTNKNDDKTIKSGNTESATENDDQSRFMDNSVDERRAVIESRLKWLSKVRGYKIFDNGEGCSRFQRYTVEDADNNLVATYEPYEGELNFFVSGVYNSVSNTVQINMDALLDLVSFCKFLEGGNVEK